MAHLHKKIKKGRPYYYIREIQRVGGKPTVVSQVYLGSVESIANRFRDAALARKPLQLKAREFGALFLAHEIEQRIDTIGWIDGIVARSPHETGPTIGEYFFFAWANRLIDPKSKRALPDWYRSTAIDEIRPVDVDELTSQRFWEKWDRVTPEQVDAIGRAFFKRVWTLQPLPPECLLFDTTDGGRDPQPEDGAQEAVHAGPEAGDAAHGVAGVSPVLPGAAAALAQLRGDPGAVHAGMRAAAHRARAPRRCASGRIPTRWHGRRLSSDAT